MEKDQLKDKGFFVVGLLAAFLAFSAYKTELSHIRIQIGHSAPALSSLFLVSIIFLGLAVYFYALSYLRYTYPKIQNWPIFKFLMVASDFFYLAGILFPLLVLVVWILSGIPKPNHQVEVAIFAFDIFGGAFIVGVAFVNAIFQLRRTKDKDIEKIDSEKTNLLQHALELYNNKFYGETIVESYKVFESYLRERLLSEKGLYSKEMNLHELLNLASKYKLLDTETADQAKLLRSMRNQAAHGGSVFSNDQAQLALSIIRSILGNED